MKYQVGDRICLSKEREGIIRYAGLVYFSTGIWYGIEFYRACGKHNGVVDGIQYFQCDKQRGIFLRASKIRRKMREQEIAERGPNQFAPASNSVQPANISQETLKMFHESKWSLLPYNIDSLKATTIMERILPKAAFNFPTVGDALKWICSRLNIENELNLYLLFGGFVLENDKSFEYYGINKDSYVLLIVREGSDNSEMKIEIENEKERNCDHLSKIKNINLVLSSNQTDMITLQSDQPCFIMPCGHSISSQSLLQYTKHTLKSNKTAIICPYMNDKNEMCKKIWEYPLIREIIQVKDHIRKIIELYYSYNLLAQNFNAQRCGYCNTIQIRNGIISSNHSTCRVCQIKTNFCWGCRKPLSSKLCEDPKCPLNTDSHWLKLIQNCGTKKIGSVENVPTLRACPKCFQLIEHETACKHMHCRMCNTNFCFVCLKLCLPSGWQCGDSSTPCPIEPIQTGLQIKNQIKNLNPNSKQACKRRSILHIPNKK